MLVEINGVHRAYTRMKIPDIKPSQISESLYRFWADHYEALSAAEKKIINAKLFN